MDHSLDQIVEHIKLLQIQLKKKPILTM